MSNYKQVTGIDIETISSNAHTNETLKAHYQSNDLVTIYFGLKDDNGNYEGIITYKSGDDLNATIKSMYTIEVTFVNIPNTNKETKEITEKTNIYCYEYINNKWKLYGSSTFISPNGKSAPLVYKSVAHY